MQAHTYFRSEATEYLGALELAAESGMVEADEVLRRARALTGAARLAGEDRVVRAATALEHATRALPDTPEALRALLRDSLRDIRHLLTIDGPTHELDARAAAVIERCAGLEAASPEAVDDDGPGEEDFRAFVAREAEGVATTLERGVNAFSQDPANREPLGAILRRQRALLGAARLDEIAIVAETLRAVEEIAEVIVRLDVPIKSEWLDVFRRARDVMHAAADSLRAGEMPAQTPALSRLRTLREELIDRYGDREGDEPHQLDGERPADDTQRAEMRERAAALRTDLMNAIGANARARSSLEEMYGLVIRALQ